MKNRYTYTLLLFLLVLLTTFSCTKTEPFENNERTVLVYIALNNSLSGEIGAIHDALKDGWSPKAMGSLVILTHSRGDKNPMLLKFKEHKGKTVADTLRMYSNMSSASPELLRQVIKDTKVIAPSKSYGLILFSHASGWLPEKAYRNPAWLGESTSGQIVSRSIFEDNGREMEFADFAAAIPDGMFEFIASEMCFMSSVETAYALRNKAKYILASAPEMLSPGFTPIYKSSLGLLYKSKPDLEGFGQAFFDYFNGLQGDYKSAVISLVKTSEMESLAALTREIAPKINQEQIDQVQVYDRFGKPNVFFDFGDYIRKAATPKQMEEMDKLLDKTVIFKRNTPRLININIARHSGLSVYIPQERLTRLNSAYENTEWYKRITK